MLRAEYKTKRKQTIKILIRMGTQKSINIVKDPGLLIILNLEIVVL